LTPQKRLCDFRGYQVTLVVGIGNSRALAKSTHNPSPSTGPREEAASEPRPPSLPTPEAASEPRPPSLPTPWQCALLILYLIRAREDEFKKKGLERTVSRARLSQNTIRKLCGRSQIPNDFLLEVQEYLLAAGWALFCIGPTHYAIVKLKSVQGWSRISSNRIADDLKLVPRGEFPWKQYEVPSTPKENNTAEDDDEETGDEGEGTD
jgi:hypothetical protein